MRHWVSSFSRSSMLPSFPMIRGTFVGETSPPDVRAPRGAPDLPVPRALRRMEGRGVRGVDAHEPMGWPDVDDLADDGVAGLGDGTAGQREDAGPPGLF